MKLSKRQLKRIIREEKRKLQEAIESAGQNSYAKMDTSGIYPRPQHPMIANAGAQTDSARIDSIMDELMMVMDLQDEPELVEQVAEAILARLKSDGLI